MLRVCVCVLFKALVEYKNLSGKTLQQSIESEMSGNLEEVLVAIGMLNAWDNFEFVCV